MDTILLENYNISKNNKDILKNINFSFDCNVSLIGTSCSGKTSLLRVLEKEYNVPRVYKNFYFYNSSVEDELKYLILTTEQQRLVQNLLPHTDLRKRPVDLKNDEKIKLCILKGLIKNNNYVSFDNILNYLSKKDKKFILDYLKDNNIKYIIVSNELDDLFYTDKTYIMNEGEIIARGNSEDIMLEEKLLKRLGFRLPFMVDLSIQLKEYRLINNIYLDKQKLIDKLWK